VLAPAAHRRLAEVGEIAAVGRMPGQSSYRAKSSYVRDIDGSRNAGARVS